MAHQLVQLDQGKKVERWTIKKKLGEGTFGAVYKVSDKTGTYALKVEGVNEPIHLLKTEVLVLNELSKAGGRHFCKLEGKGQVDNFNYVVMTFVGKSLHDLRIAAPGKKFTVGTAISIGIQCLEALEDLHGIGYLHRDVRPANHTIGRAELKEVRKVYVFDFGMARKFVHEDGTIKKPRSNVGFRGTVKYASVACHARRDMCRLDDLESWLYQQIEFTKGALPWRNLKDMDEIGRFKKSCRDIEMKQLFGGCPREYIDILRTIDGGKFFDEPNYPRVYSLLRRAMKNLNAQEYPYDWERWEEQQKRQHEEKKKAVAAATPTSMPYYSDPTEVIVRNFNASPLLNDLWKLFKCCGKVLGCSLKEPCVAVIEYASKEEAEKAVRILNGYKYQEAELVVQLKTTPPVKSSTAAREMSKDTCIPNLQSNIPMPTTPTSIPYCSDPTAAAYGTPPLTTSVSVAATPSVSSFIDSKDPNMLKARVFVGNLNASRDSRKMLCNENSPILCDSTDAHEMSKDYCTVEIVDEEKQTYTYDKKPIAPTTTSNQMVIIAKTPGSKVTNEEDGDYGNLTQDENNKSHHPLVEIVQTPGGQFVKTPSSNKNNSARIHNGGKVNFQSGNGNRNGNVKQSIKNKTSNH